MKKRILIILLNIFIVLFLVACEPNEIKKNDENIDDEDNPGLVEDNNDNKTDENDDSNDEKEYKQINITIILKLIYQNFRSLPMNFFQIHQNNYIHLIFFS